MFPSLEELLEAARNHVWTEEEKHQHAISFAYGNLKLSGWEGTREDIEREADKLLRKEAFPS